MCKNSSLKQVNRENSIKYKKVMQSDKIRFFLEIDFGKFTLTDEQRTIHSHIRCRDSVYYKIVQNVKKSEEAFLNILNIYKFM